MQYDFVSGFVVLNCSKANPVIGVNMTASFELKLLPFRRNYTFGIVVASPRHHESHPDLRSITCISTSINGSGRSICFRSTSNSNRGDV